MENLKPWMDLDQIKGNKPGTSYTERKVESLGDVVELLLERKNRVWARVFIHGLSCCLDTSPKLHDWAHQLNCAGQHTFAFSTYVLKGNANLPAAYLCTLSPLDYWFSSGTQQQHNWE